MIAPILTILSATSGFVGILWLCRRAVQEKRENEAAELREMLRQDKRRENAAWYISTRQNDARADLFRVYVELEVR